MKTYAMYVGSKETKVPKCRVYIVGYYHSPKSYIIRCMKTEFIYSSFESMNKEWKFFVETKEPYCFE